MCTWWCHIVTLVLMTVLSFIALFRAKKKTKPLNLKIHSSVGSCENLPTQRSPLHTERSLRSFFFPSFVPSTPPVHAETPSASKCPHLFLINSHTTKAFLISLFHIIMALTSLYWVSSGSFSFFGKFNVLSDKFSSVQESEHGFERSLVNIILSLSLITL